MELYPISYWAEAWLVVRSARAVRAPLFHESGTRRIKPPHKTDQRPTSPLPRLTAGAFSNKENALKRSLYLAIATIALVAAPRVSQAQLGLVKPFSLGVAGGVTQPMSDLSDAAKPDTTVRRRWKSTCRSSRLVCALMARTTQFGEKITGAGKLHAERDG